ncbi:MAG: YihY/virulence factor BrkB family protein [Tannerellaceae bacterium]|jgi:membrane protein|nr:YihY/virulence factor BrkB family protein [Tannerellaceae bacterium]
MDKHNGNTFARIVRFITDDIWRITENEVSGIRHIVIRVIKTLILAVRGFLNDNLQTKASALTFNTLLAIVPLLAVVLGIAKGFGYQDTVRQSLIGYFPGQTSALAKAFDFVDNYLTLAQGGLFLGIGLVLLLYTVISLLSSIEETLNGIWEIHKPRPLYRRISDYLVLCLVLPVLMTASGGLSIFLSSVRMSFLSRYVFFTPFIDFTLSIAPYVITSLIFTALYILLPNTRVKFLSGLPAGIVAGCAFQFFQFLYISGQIWVGRYNAIYGGFAALPLLLLWLQLSWIICLFGASLAYASQNVEKFSFERDSKNISRRYKDFLTVLITSLIVRRFAEGEKPYTADELSTRYCIPLRLTSQLLYLLVETAILIEVTDIKDDRIVRYQPAVDINRLSIAFLLSRIDEYGSENFKIDIQNRFRPQWQALLNSRQDMMRLSGQTLLKDL